jgi:hypothetical protein
LTMWGNLGHQTKWAEFEEHLDGEVEVRKKL